MAKKFDVASHMIMLFDNQHADTETRTFDIKQNRANTEQRAYVIFRSGSTGQPKGVVIQHHAITRTLAAYAERLDFTASTRALLFASFSFDVSVMGTWSVIAAGGALCIVDEEERIANMIDFLLRSEVDCVALTPTGAMLLDPAKHRPLKTLLFCGEETKSRDIDRWTNVPDLRLVNAYRPSETSVNAILNTDFSKDDLSNIGQTMGGGLWIVDPDNHNRLALLAASERFW